MNGHASLRYVHTFATLPTSKTRHSGVPFCSRWTVSATNALWFGEVHASVAKFNSPSYVCSPLSPLWREARELFTYPQHVSNSLACACKNHLNITRYCPRWRYVILWASCFHQRLKTTIIYNVEGLSTLCNPADDFSPKTSMLRRVSLSIVMLEQTLFLFLCVASVRRRPFLFQCVQTLLWWIHLGALTLFQSN